MLLIWYLCGTRRHKSEHIQSARVLQQVIPMTGKVNFAPKDTYHYNVDHTIHIEIRGQHSNTWIFLAIG